MTASDFCAASIACLMLRRLPWSTPSVMITITLRPDFALQLVVRRQVDGVVEHRAARLADGRHRTGMEPLHAGAGPQLAQPLGQQPRAVGVILQQLGLFAEADQEGFVLLAQHLGEELRRGAAFDLDQVALAAAHIHQQADRQRRGPSPA